jgi:hypothetical protein
MSSAVIHKTTKGGSQILIEAIIRTSQSRPITRHNASAPMYCRHGYEENNTPLQKGNLLQGYCAVDSKVVMYREVWV